MDMRYSLSTAVNDSSQIFAETPKKASKSVFAYRPFANTKAPGSQAGMTLVELIAVIFLIALIMTVVGGKVFSASGSAKAKLNEVKMNTVKQYLAQYRLQYNNYPARLEDLITPSSDVQRSGTLFTPLAKRDELKDVWNQDFIYTPENNGRSYVLKSLGADGVPGGEGENQDLEMRP